MKRKLFIVTLFFGAIFYLFLMNPLSAAIFPPSTDFYETDEIDNYNNQIAKIRLRADSQDMFWTLEIKATGQSLKVSNVRLGIDPIAQTYPYPPLLPGAFSAVIKIKGGESGYTEDLRIPGSIREVWDLTVLVVGPSLGGIADANQPGFFPELSWEPSAIGSAKAMELRLGDANGPVLADMTATTTYQTLESEAEVYSSEISYAVFSYSVVFESTGTYTFYQDADEDGYGDPNIFIVAETQPQGYVFRGDDCDDTNPDVYPLAEELYDGIDNDCDGETDEGLGTIYYADIDGDTYGDPNNTVTSVTRPEGYAEQGTDCDDTNSDINPSAEEIDDGLDNNCNGEIDEEPATYYADEDGDGHGDINNFIISASQPSGYVLIADDCDDTDPAINPGKWEECNGFDDDCDGMVDEKNSVGCIRYFKDYDQDGYGVIYDSRCICVPEGYYTATLMGDPDDFDPDVPTVLEKSGIFKMSIRATGQGGDVSSVQIGVDLIGDAYPYPPSPPPDFTVVLKDKIGEKYFGGDIRGIGSGTEVWNLSVMVGGNSMGGSADMDLPGFFPVLSWDPNVIRPEFVMELRLKDANGLVLADMKTADTYQTKETDAIEYIPSFDYALFSYAVVFHLTPSYYRDADEDGYGDPNTYITADEQPAGYVTDSTDCNDNDPNINPSEEELIDGVDNNCNGQIDEEPTTYYADADHDGFGDPNNTVVAFSQPAGYVPMGNDCDDTDPDVYPGAQEICDGKDNDCDGYLLSDEVDSDQDGFMICEGDSDDTDPDTYPGVPGSSPGGYYPDYYYGTCGYSCPYAENICPVLWCQPLPQPCCYTDGNIIETFDEDMHRFKELTINSLMEVDTNQGVLKMTILPLTKVSLSYGDDTWMNIDPNYTNIYGQYPAPYDPNDATFADANDPDYDPNAASSEGNTTIYGYPLYIDPNLPAAVYPLGQYEEDMPYGPDTEGPAGVCAITTNCALVGDFDVQFDFCLDDFPLLASNTGSRTLDLDILPLFCGKVCSISRAMNFEDPNGVIHESCYVARLFDDPDKVVVQDTNDACGKFKASRRGNSITLFVWSDPGNDWSLLLDGSISGTDPNGPSEYLEAVVKTQILAIPETDANCIEGHTVSIDNFRVECLSQPAPLTESNYPCPACGPSSCCADGSVQDAFEGGLDGNRWKSMVEDGALILDQDQTLRFYMPDTDANTQFTGLYMGEGPRAKVATKCLACGDFDVRVDYNLVSFPSIEDYAATRHVSLSIEGFSPDFNLMNTGEEPRYITYPLASVERVKAADGNDYHYAQTGYYSPHMEMADANRISGQLRVTREGGNLDLYYRFIDQNDWTLLLSHNAEDEVTFHHVTPCVRIALEAGYSIMQPYTYPYGTSTSDPNQFDPNSYGYGYIYPYSPYYASDANMPDVQGQVTEFDNFHLECVPLDPNQDYSYDYSCFGYYYPSYDPNTGYPYPISIYDPNYIYYDTYPYPYTGYYGGYASAGGGYGYGSGLYYGGNGSNLYSPGIGNFYQYFFDADNDGLGDPNKSIIATSKPEGYVSSAGDSCPDDPNKTEPGICGCGVADIDADQDGSYECQGDCDETDNTVYPGATEICDGKDNDCDGTVPADEADEDGDGVRICEGDCDDTDADINPAAAEVYDGIDNDCKDGPDDHCYFTIDLSASGQGAPLAEVRFGLDFGAAAIQIDPNNWSDDGILRLQLIDAMAGDIEITDPDTFTESHYLVEDIRVASGQTGIAWYLMVEISEEKNPDLSERYPVLSWDPNNFGCVEIDGNDYIYQLIRGLSGSGSVLVDNMVDADSYQTVSKDGETVKYFTILWREKPEPPVQTKKSYMQILPWPGMYQGGLGWPSFSLTGGFLGGLPFPAKVGYPSGLSRPSFPGTYPSLTFSGWTYPSWTSIPGYSFPGWTYSSWMAAPTYSFLFPGIGVLPSAWTSLPPLYWNLSPGAGGYNTGWSYTYR
ncbi:MAG: putative metal-binding motif-containing protein [bacterium]